MDQYMKHNPHQYQYLPLKSTSQKLDNIQEEDSSDPLQLVENIEVEVKRDEECHVSNVPELSVQAPETPTETMEFLARSWSVSALEISRALSMLERRDFPEPKEEEKQNNDGSVQENATIDRPKLATQKPISNDSTKMTSPPISPRSNLDMKILRGARGSKTMGGWIKEQKEKKRAEARSRNAQAYAATSVAGVAAAVAAIVAGTVFPSNGSRNGNNNNNSNNRSKTAAAIASASALVASHCVEMAQAMGASQEQILTVIHSAVNAQTSGDVMALTAGAATALRASAMLRLRLQKELVQNTPFIGEFNESQRYVSPLIFVSRGGELLKRTRKGILHWKQVSVYINSNCQVIVKMKSTHMAGTYIKTKKSLIMDVCSEIVAWPGREVEENMNRRAYFGIKTQERNIEFECRNKNEQKLWIRGIKEMIKRHDNMNNNLM